MLGGDGAMWFGEQNGIGRSDANGNITEYPMVQPQQLVAGPDGAVWFTTYYDNATGVQGELCRVTPDGTVTKRNLNLQGTRIALGADNNFWIAENGASITRVTPAGAVTRFPLTAPGGSAAHANDVVAGPDGNLWVSDGAQNALYVVSTAGTQTRTVAISPPPQNAGPVRSTFATDGTFWFTTQNSVVRVTPSSGAAAEFNQFPGTLLYLSGIGPGSPILGASDGNIWTTGSWVGGGFLPAVFRVAPNGAILALPLPASTMPALGPTQATGLANGPGGTVWYVRGKSVGWFTPTS
jgi:streptogramin lyase